MPLLMATSTFGLRIRWNSAQQCYLHCFHVAKTNLNRKIKVSSLWYNVLIFNGSHVLIMKKLHYRSILFRYSSKFKKACFATSEYEPHKLSLSQTNLDILHRLLQLGHWLILQSGKKHKTTITIDLRISYEQNAYKVLSVMPLCSFHTSIR